MQIGLAKNLESCGWVAVFQFSWYVLPWIYTGHLISYHSTHPLTLFMCLTWLVEWEHVVKWWWGILIYVALLRKTQVFGQRKYRCLWIVWTPLIGSRGGLDKKSDVLCATASGVPRNFVWRGGSTNSVEDRRQRERGSGGGSPLFRGSGGSCNFVQEISFHIVKFS